MPALVVPAVATTITGTQPSRRSAAIAASAPPDAHPPLPSVGTSRAASRPMPA